VEDVVVNASLLVLLGPMLLAAVGHRAPQRATGPQAPRDYAAMNVCQVVPGKTIARALGGTLADTRPFADKARARKVAGAVATELWKKAP
jgi:hypothetical protein